MCTTDSRVIIITSTYKPHAVKLSKDIIKFLEARGFSCDQYEYDGMSSENPVKQDYAFAICLGGDGTVLFASRCCAARKIPVFAINFGNFGFIAVVEPEHWQTVLEDYLAGKIKIFERMLLSACILRKRQEFCVFDALNDVVISGSGIAKLVNLEVLFNDVSFGTYKADGVIISTPTGSTAYSAASGGPILDPNVSAFVLTPIAAFSLSNRPIVLPAEGKMTVKVLPTRHRDTILSVDGQELFVLEENDIVSVSASVHKAHLIGCNPEMFYRALRSKLAWSGNSTCPVPIQ
ncbi:NAD(+)/NADH kinase [Treponema phagedenis]|uniref:NAD(+)/NADH kinase n=1 Tax=Treponema phagedenis TaxID=162 RepID=UPI0011ED63F4|nr:NAD(+)/NADH kinase [Treponema phagedenis]TYT77956.1 NAD(+)/NADH kinase [Treponema phagedenis]